VSGCALVRSFPRLSTARLRLLETVSCRAIHLDQRERAPELGADWFGDHPHNDARELLGKIEDVVFERVNWWYRSQSREGKWKR
jgi:hypothetical protein